MPKQVDHQERRREIVEALLRLVGRDGLGAASIRAVASEAGVRAPQVQYYFGTKAALLHGALEVLGERVVSRGIALMREAGADPPPEARLRAALAGSRPVDDASRTDLVLFFTFYAAALTDASMAETDLFASQSWITQYLAALLREAQERGETHDGVDPDHEARLILFANTGLLVDVLAGVHSIEDADAAIDYHLAKVFRGPESAGRTRTRGRRR